MIRAPQITRIEIGDTHVFADINAPTTVRALLVDVFDKPDVDARDLSWLVRANAGRLSPDITLETVLPKGSGVVVDGSPRALSALVTLSSGRHELTEYATAARAQIAMLKLSNRIDEAEHNPLLSGRALLSVAESLSRTIERSRLPDTAQDYLLSKLDFVFCKALEQMESSAALSWIASHPSPRKLGALELEKVAFRHDPTRAREVFLRLDALDSDPDLADAAETLRHDFRVESRWLQARESGSADNYLLALQTMLNMGGALALLDSPTRSGTFFSSRGTPLFGHHFLRPNDALIAEVISRARVMRTEERASLIALLDEYADLASTLGATEHVVRAEAMLNVLAQEDAAATVAANMTRARLALLMGEPAAAIASLENSIAGDDAGMHTAYGAEGFALLATAYLSMIAVSDNKQLYIDRLMSLRTRCATSTDSSQELNARLSLLVVSGLVAAGEGVQAQDELAVLSHSTLPWVQRAVEKTRSASQTTHVEAFFRTLVCEANTETLGEALAMTVAGAVSGAALGGLLFGTGSLPGAAIGAGIGMTAGISALKIRNIVRGAARIRQAATTGFTAYARTQSAMAAAQLALDLLSVGRVARALTSTEKVAIRTLVTTGADEQTIVRQLTRLCRQAAQKYGALAADKATQYAAWGLLVGPFAARIQALQKQSMDEQALQRELEALCHELFDAVLATGAFVGIGHASRIL